MKKARLILTALLVSATFAACSTSITAPDDCTPTETGCVFGVPSGNN